MTEPKEQVAASDLRIQLWHIHGLARMEQLRPTGFHMTCLSLIEKAADKALQILDGTPGLEAQGTRQISSPAPAVDFAAVSDAANEERLPEPDLGPQGVS